MNKEQEALFRFCLQLGDSSLVLGHRLSEWCGHGPVLEEDIAMTNISLDLIGQSRFILAYAGETEAKGRTEDDLAFQRDAREYFNFLICEQQNGDFGFTMARQFLFSVYQFFIYSELMKSKNKSLAGLAEKSLKEVTYHVRHSEDWMLRLGDGTEESHKRVQSSADELWRFTGDLFEADELDSLLVKSGVAPDLQMIKPKWIEKVSDVFSKATLMIPNDIWMVKGSRKGIHTEHLGYLLAEMQFLPRAYPGAKW